MIASKRFAIEHSVDLILILLRDFFDAIIKICFILPRCALFSCTSFDLSEMSLASRTERRKALSSAYSSRKKCMWIAVILSPIVFISLYGVTLSQGTATFSKI